MGEDVVDGLPLSGLFHARKILCPRAEVTRQLQFLKISVESRREAGRRKRSLVGYVLQR